MQFTGPGWRWHITWMEFWRKCLAVDLGEMQPGWRWDMNMGTGMEVRFELDGSEIQISVPKWRWDGTRMEVMQISHDLDSYETGPGSGWRWDASFGTRMDDTSPGRRRWEASMRTWIEVRLDLDGEETGILESRWSLDLETWTGVEMRPGFSWDAHFETWLVWHRIRIEPRCNSRELDGGDMRHRWWCDKNLGSWMQVRQNLDGFEMPPGWSSDTNVWPWI